MSLIFLLNNYLRKENLLKKIINYDYYVTRTVCDERVLQQHEPYIRTYVIMMAERPILFISEVLSIIKGLLKLVDVNYSKNKLFDVIQIDYRLGESEFFVIPAIKN